MDTFRKGVCMTEKKSSRVRSMYGSRIKEKIQKTMLRKCKFCDSEKRGFLYMNYIIYKNVIVKCNDCGYTTNNHKNEYLAMLEWNKDILVKE